MPRLGLHLSGNGKSGSGIAGIQLYSDTLQTAVSFNDRQWFCSDNSNSVLYGAQTSSGSGVETTAGHLLVHFDCRKEQYPNYDNGVYYNGGGQEVYAGYYGHAIFKSMSPMSSGYPPIFTASTAANDANGWIRIRPALRTIQAGQYLNVSFKLEVISPTTFFDNSNAIRIGILGSSGSVANLVNTDTIGQSAIFSPYTGYLIGIGKNHRIYKRIPDSLNSTSLVSSMAAYTQLTNDSMTFNAGGANPVLSVDIKIGRTGANTIIRSVVSGYQANGHVTSGILSTFSDTADTLSFDTLAVQAASLNMSSFRVSNPYVALYSGSL